MNYKPFGNRVVGKLKKSVEKKTESGLYIPLTSETERYDEVEIVAVGRGYVTQQGNIVEMESKVGDVVLIMKNSGLPLPKKGNDELDANEEYVVFQESDIICRKL
jgi:chaperonin GroES